MQMVTSPFNGTNCINDNERSLNASEIDDEKRQMKENGKIYRSLFGS